MEHFNMKKIFVLVSMFILIGCALSLLTGCASITPERIEVAMSTCPVLKKYTQEQMKQAASELKSLPTEAQIATMMTDYSKLRQACRLAEQKLKDVASK